MHKHALEEELEQAKRHAHNTKIANHVLTAKIANLRQEMGQTVLGKLS